MSELQMQGVAWSCPNCAELERERDAAHSEVIPKILAALGPLGEYGREQCNRADKAEADNRALREALRRTITAHDNAWGEKGTGSRRPSIEFQRDMAEWDAAITSLRALLAAPQEPAQERDMDKPLPDVWVQLYQSREGVFDTILHRPQRLIDKYHHYVPAAERDALRERCERLTIALHDAIRIAELERDKERRAWISRCRTCGWDFVRIARAMRALRIIERWRATDRASLPTRSARG